MGVREEKGGEPPVAEPVARAASQPARTRKFYHKPAFRYESVFETTALSCGKVNSTQFSCRFNRHSS